ncbi:MAG: FecR domain-containing protein [Mediterranea sp.]|jgi:ferric-dicitrate binding protein FerR (iron transport regulator)|nr:FecR domain-containing protein [Mediterranea sp.]
MGTEETNNQEKTDRLIDGIRISSPRPTGNYSVGRSLASLMHRIEAESLVDDAKDVRRQIRRYRVWLAAATVALLLSVGGWLFYGQQGTDPVYVVATNNSQRVREVRLPDGTTVKLNSHSRLIYPERFEGKRREVFLEGEVFFEVSHDKRHPFVVRAGNLNITVLGTKFNVRANIQDSLITTTLLEGSVQVSHEENCVRMRPGQRLTYDMNNNSLQLTDIANAARDARWTQDVWTLTDTPLQELCHRIEQMYDVKFVITNERLLDKSFTGEFHLGEPLDSLLRTMQVSSVLSYEKKGKTIILR